MQKRVTLGVACAVIKVIFAKKVLQIVIDRASNGAPFALMGRRSLQREDSVVRESAFGLSSRVGQLRFE